ncbi:hypothetical protein [Actinomadura sp. WMMB 499]|uniref:hypothetical protein n=1 Tax=Actinomadura sp. WMMB 499 TaxID=1219491 RepID=UPI00159E4927|nr:hypothetical protein [Actinomadura sp. WMMB 499]
MDTAYLLGLVEGANKVLGDDPITDDVVRDGSFTRRELAIIRYLALKELEDRVKQE